MISKKVSRWSIVSLFLMFTIFLAGCGGRTREGCDPVAATPENGNNSLIADPLITATPQDPETIQAVWKVSPHADAYVVAVDNMNSSCARCHAPLDWAPTAKDIPANWTANKVEVAPASVLITELEWTHVDCKVCHNTEVDQITGDFVWLEIAPLEIYSEVETSTELCQKCHLTNKLEGHQSLMLEGNHRDFLCTDCHDAHTTTATCSSSGCHEPFANECESIETHDKPHSEVTCSACHAGGDPRIDWNEDVGAWDTFVPVGDEMDDEFKPFTSHNILLEVDCDRCHEPGNHPWDP